MTKKPGKSKTASRVPRERIRDDDDKKRVGSMYDIPTLDGDVRNDLLRISGSRLADVAVFCNNYPSIEIDVKVKDLDDIVAGGPVTGVVTIERNTDDDYDEDNEQQRGRRCDDGDRPSSKQNGSSTTMNHSSSDNNQQMRDSWTPTRTTAAPKWHRK